MELLMGFLERNWLRKLKLEPAGAKRKQPEEERIARRAIRKGPGGRRQP